ncbi:MAG: hypothetical protein ACRECH_10195 [Nitrososphaerales archaeon]
MPFESRKGMDSAIGLTVATGGPDLVTRAGFAVAGIGVIPTVFNCF